MHALLGYFICLVVLTPAFSVDVFFALIGATTRLHDLLGMLRAISRMLQSVTSPYKIALTVAVLLGLFAVDFARSTRGLGLLLAGAIGSLQILHTVPFHQAAGTGLAIALVPWTAVILLSFRWGSRLITTSPC